MYTFSYLCGIINTEVKIRDTEGKVMFESKYSKVLTVILIIVIIAIIGLLGFLGYDYYQNYIVTKDTGKTGGFNEKLEAAKAAGAELIVIGRPKEQSKGYTLDELKKIMQEEYIKERI